MEKQIAYNVARKDWSCMFLLRQPFENTAEFWPHLKGLLPIIFFIRYRAFPCIGIAKFMYHVHKQHFYNMYNITGHTSRYIQEVCDQAHCKDTNILFKMIHFTQFHVGEYSAFPLTYDETILLWLSSHSPAQGTKQNC